MYFVKCKKVTPNSGKIKIKKTKNNRKLAQVKCKICGSLKSSFI
jgi:hypothetical protein